ncbi:glycosyltransferase family 39 protein [Cellulomonas sp. URHB0016]
MAAAEAARSPFEPPAVAWVPVLAVAGALLVVLVTFAGRYGPHRDELYFVAAGRRLAWGYPDQPPLTPLVARVSDLVAPGSVTALHLPSAVAMAAFVLLAALTARELGGGTGAQVLTAVTAASGAVTAILGHMLSTATLDLLFWTAVVYVTVRVLQRDQPRGWVVVGLLTGVALEDKHLVAFLLAGIVVGVALTPAVRHHLRSRWAWLGVGVALLLWLPNLAWQGTHGWPQLELAADIRDEYSTLEERITYVVLVLVLFSPVTAVLWVYGLVRLLRAPALVRARPMAFAFVLLFVGFFVTGGKAYYLAGLVPVLFAAGACGLAERWSTRGLWVAGAVVALSGLVVWPAALPILPERDFGESFFADVNEDQAETIGWPRLVETVDKAVSSSGAALVVTENYGEAGALEFYGSPVPVLSGHNGYADWGPPPSDDGPVVLVGFDAAPAWVVGCEQVATVDDGVDVDNEEQGARVWACAGPRGSWAEVWDEVRRLSA